MDVPPIIGGKYRVLRELGRGGMGVIYVVEHQGTGEELALKVMSDRLLSSPQAIERFKREARAPTRIKSEHVVRVIDADTATELGGAPFLVMELLDGDDLEKLGESQPSPATIVEWLRQAGLALDRAHALGFVHRDLKPANLFLARRTDGPPIVKVLDFGIVKVLEDSGATESGATVGTPRYMAPEQVLAERGTVGPAADIWAMGLVAFRLLTGRDYWQADTTVMLIAKILHGRMPAPSERGCELGEAFDAWFLRSCAREPRERFTSVGAQMESLAEALAGQSLPSNREAAASNPLGHASTTPLDRAPADPTPPRALAASSPAPREPSEPSETVLAVPTGESSIELPVRASLSPVTVGIAVAAVGLGLVAWLALRDPAPDAAGTGNPVTSATARGAGQSPETSRVVAPPAGTPTPSTTGVTVAPIDSQVPAPTASPRDRQRTRPSASPTVSPAAPPSSKPKSDPLADPL